MRRESSTIVCGFLYGLAASLALAANSAAVQDAQVSVVRDGDFVVVSASADMPVERRVAWEVLTNYDRYAEFIPHLRVSRVLSRGNDGVVVEQKGEFTFLFFSQPMELRFAVVEKPQFRIESHALAGSLKNLTSKYELRDVPGGLRLIYSGRFVPDIGLPPFIGLVVVRSAMEKQFSALVGEIMRRNGEHRTDNVRPAG